MKWTTSRIRKRALKLTIDSSLFDPFIQFIPPSCIVLCLTYLLSGVSLDKGQDTSRLYKGQDKTRFLTLPCGLHFRASPSLTVDRTTAILVKPCRIESLSFHFIIFHRYKWQDNCHVGKTLSFLLSFLALRGYHHFCCRTGQLPYW